ncbi:hypothetical protein BDV96DRAFT_590625 [Lophiotrema nucula]|uniref:Uncharacterized protein n=1 Tax=Lophiotrema nucula TaxID=690887 RepID=A0A6A5YHX8_9PLEO|nr:hypothetical protein BDV96DRAFT_590625 [Lophiotrema nucula]
MIGWFEKSSIRKIGSSSWKQSKYSEEIDDAINDLETESEKLRRLANDFIQDVNLDARQGVRRIEAEVGDVKDGVTDLEIHMRGFKATIKTCMADFLRDDRANREWTGQMLEKIFSKLDVISTAASRPSPPTPPNPQPPLEVKVYQVLQPTGISLQYLLQYLDVDVAAVQRAFVQASDPRHVDEQTCSQIFQLLMSQPRFLRWLRSKESDVLALNRTDLDTDDTSTFALFAATLAESLATTAGALILHFFSPLRDQKYPPNSGFLLRSLISQLCLNSNNAVILPEELSFNLPDLRMIFMKLLFALDYGQTVFIFVHDLSYHANRNEVEAIFAVDLLCELGRLPVSPKLRVKVLFTPSLPMKAWKMVPPGNVVDLPEDTDHCQDFGLSYVMGSLGERVHG